MTRNYYFMNFLSKKLSKLFILIFLSSPIAGHCTDYLRALPVYGVGHFGWIEDKEEARSKLEILMCENNAGVKSCKVNWIKDYMDSGGSWWASFGYEYTLWDDTSTGPGMVSAIGINLLCPTNTRVDSTNKLCIRETPEENCDKCQKGQNEDVKMGGNPVSIAGGTKYQVETDYTNQSGSLSFTRTYRSDRSTWANNFDMMTVDLNTSDPDVPGNSVIETVRINQQVFPNHRFPFVYSTRPYNAVLRRGNGRVMNFGGDTGFTGPADVNDRVEPILGPDNKRIGFLVKNAASGAIERYSFNGAIEESSLPSGQKKIFSYSDANTPKEISIFAGLLIKVADEHGNAIRFTYNEYGQMVSLIDCDGYVTLYAYNPDGLISAVTRPDGTVRTYVYGESAYISDPSQSRKLTGIIDENGSRFSTYKYNYYGRAFSTEHAESVDKWTFTFGDGYATATDPRGLSANYFFSTILGTAKIQRGSYPVGNSYFSYSYQYDMNGNVINRDMNGVVTNFSYDQSRNLETLKVEAPNTSIVRHTTTAWHPDFRLPVTIAQPKRLTRFTYDTNARMLSRSEQATSDPDGRQGFNTDPVGPLQVWTWTYDTFGKKLTENAPGVRPVPTQTYAYDASGNLATVTNAIGHIIAYSNYDKSGRVGRIVLPNGIKRDFSYSPRGWVTSVTVSNSGLVEKTSYSFDGIGQVTKVRSSDGSTLDFTYDAAHRLTSIVDGLGNRIDYTLDNSGNRISEKKSDNSGTLKRSVARIYDPLNRLQQVTGAAE